jgi:glycolate oxidase FAD binding subunit
VAAARAKLGGAELHDAAAFWQRLREQTTPFFDRRPPPSNKNLWRLAVKPTTGPLQLGEAQWIEWGGAVRWLASDLPAAVLRERAHGCGGHATLFRHAPAIFDGALLKKHASAIFDDALSRQAGPPPQPSPRTGEGTNVMPTAINDGVFAPLPPALLTLHKNLKLRFDPKGIFNRGRLYPDF